MLSASQLIVLKQIQQSFFPGDQTLVHLRGAAGSGKTSIIFEYLNLIQREYEDWMIYYIEGKDPEVEPYSTITLSGEMDRPEIKLAAVNLSAGFNIASIFNLGVTTSLQQNNKINEKVDFVIRELNGVRQQNILFIADSFQYWDASSQQFLNTLINYPLLLTNKSLRILLVTDEDATGQSSEAMIKRLSKKGLQIDSSLPTKEELPEIVRLLGYKLEISAELADIIMSLTGGNIDFIKLFLEGCSDKINSLSLEQLDSMKLLDYRLEKFGERKQEIIDILKVSSIVKGEFSPSEIIFLNGGDANKVEDILDESCRTSLLTKKYKFSFSNVFIRELFYKKLEGKRHRFHREYAEYLQKNKPENYLSRAIHLSLAEVYDERASEIIELFAIAYFRTWEIYGEDVECAKIHDMLHKVVQEVGSREAEQLYRQFTIVKDAYHAYFEESYELANELLQSIHGGPVLFTSELRRMQLSVALLLEKDDDVIRRAVALLEDTMQDMEKNELEQWCKNALVLLSTYSNKMDDYTKSETMYNDILRVISKKHDNKFISYIKHVLFRKACVYAHPPQALYSTADSVAYFRESNNLLQLYMAQCNHAGILIVCGKYAEALQHLDACKKLIVQYPHLTFPSQEKLDNNHFLGELFLHQQNNTFTPECLQTIIGCFERIVNDTAKESSAILHVNLMSLYLMQENFSKYQETVEVLQKKIIKNSTDSFYRYHIINSQLAESVLKQEWDSAERYCKDLVANFPIFHTKIKQIILNRNDVIERLVRERVSLPPQGLDQWVKEHSHRSNSSSSFYTRLFLFSDVQFTSL